MVWGFGVASMASDGGPDYRLAFSPSIAEI
jgi:hypothetical protein